jgi:hypothetical protein
MTSVGAAPLADVPCLPELPRLIQLKYLTTVNRWTSMITPVASLHQATGGDLNRSLIWRDLLCRYQIGDIAASVRLATGSDVPDVLLAGLHARTAGNPYFAAEAVRLLRAEGRLYTSAQLPAGLLPDTVRAVLERRLARLPDQVTELLRAAALLGDELDPPLLAEVMGEPPTVVAAALATAQAARVTGLDRFAHPLVREVLQSQLGPVDRLRGHTRIGELLARRYRAGTVGPAAAAWHLLAAAELGGKAGPAVEFARLAAADATRRTGYEDALRLLESALPHATAGTGRGGVLSELGEAALAAGDQARARRSYEEAAELARQAGSPELLAAAALGLAGGRGGFEVDLRDPDRVAVLAEGLRAQPEGDSAARARLLGRLSLALAFTGATAEQRQALSAEAMTMARRLGVPAVLAAALSARCDAISGPGHIAERRAAAAEIIELAQPRLSWYVPLWRGTRALMHGDHAQAEACAAELSDLAERSGSTNARLLALVQRYVRLMSEDRANELAGVFTRILAVLPDDPRLAVCARAFFDARRGELAQARVDLDRVVAGEAPGDGEWLPRYVQVAVAAALADHRAAAELAYRVLTPFARQCAVEGILAGSWGSVAAHLGLLARYLGRAGEADAHFALAGELDAAAGAALAARTREWAGADAPGGTAVFHLEGKVWTLRYGGRTVRLPDSKGLRDLAVLVTRPGERTHVSELAGATGLPKADLGPVADRRALAAYRERLRRIDAELDSFGEGSPEAGAARRERDALLAGLSAVAGLGGRARTTGSPAERMRKGSDLPDPACDRAGRRHTSGARPAPERFGTHRDLVRLLA